MVSGHERICPGKLAIGGSTSSEIPAHTLVDRLDDGQHVERERRPIGRRYEERDVLLRIGEPQGPSVSMGNSGSLLCGST